MNNELEKYGKRIGLNTELENISKIICEKCNLGQFISNKLITIGFEDYNYCLKTTKGKYCVKIFSNERTKNEIKSYLDRIRAVANSNVSAPKPLIINNDILISFNYNNVHYDLCVFEYVDGKNFFEINKNIIQKYIKVQWILEKL